jgi:hypothetical protein
MMADSLCSACKLPVGPRDSLFCTGCIGKQTPGSTPIHFRCGYGPTGQRYNAEADGENLLCLECLQQAPIVWNGFPQPTPQPEAVLPGADQGAAPEGQPQDAPVPPLPTAAAVPVAAAVPQDLAGQPVDMAQLAVPEQLAAVMAAEPRIPGTGLA